MQADGLADTPFDAVAQHCFAECAGCGEPDVRSARLRFAYAERREQGTGESGSVVIDASEIFRSEQAYTFGKTGDEILPLGTDSEFLAAPGPAPRQHRAPILGLHAAAETMRFRTVTIIRLKGTFRHFSSSIQYRSAGARAANRMSPVSPVPLASLGTWVPSVLLAASGAGLRPNATKRTISKIQPRIGSAVEWDRPPGLSSRRRRAPRT
jgi:hypothetical protein